MNCVFCSDPTESGDIVFEDERCWIILHTDWSPRGHAMVISRRHVENPADLDEPEWLHLARVWRTAERVLLDVTQTERSIVMKLGIQTPHLHVHIYPVSAEATRDDVFAAIEGARGEPRDAALVDAVRRHLTLLSR